jgi:predicted DNA-binding protein with PD1-like motif
MKYQVGRAGRIIVSRFEDKEDVLINLVEIVKKENVKNAIFYLIGGLKKGRVVVGPERDDLPPNPLWNDINESHELLGIGTIFYHGEDPRVHFHGAFGKRDKVKVGCLRETSETFLVIESVIIEIEGINARREMDPVSGLTLLKL